MAIAALQQYLREEKQPEPDEDSDDDIVAAVDVRANVVALILENT